MAQAIHQLALGDPFAIAQIAVNVVTSKQEKLRFVAEHCVPNRLRTLLVRATSECYARERFWLLCETLRSRT